MSFTRRNMLMVGAGGVVAQVANSVEDGFSSVEVANTEVTVGSGGDFATLNAALAEVSIAAPSYEFGGVTTVVRLLSGFVMSEQIHVRDIDLRWIRISSNDAEVAVDRSALSIPLEGVHVPLFGAENATLPVIDVLFSMNTSGSGANRHGIYLYANSRAYVTPGSGVTNAGGRGLWVRKGSGANAQASIFSGAGEEGIVANEGSSINAREAIASGAGLHGVWAINGSSIAFRDGDATNAGADGVRCDPGSMVHAPSADACWRKYRRRPGSAICSSRTICPLFVTSATASR